jgi:hypothetical protein
MQEANATRIRRGLVGSTAACFNHACSNTDTPGVMMRSATLLAVLLIQFAMTAAAQARPDPGPLMEAQRHAMKSLQTMDGEWRGTAWTLLPSGEKRVVTQTERIGPLLGGAVKLIEGRGYDADGNTVFNAFGIVSYDPAARRYTLRSYAMGQSGDFAFRPTPDGYEWEIPAGPALIRYSAAINGSRLHEVGDRIVAGSPPQRFFEMTLTRIGDSQWPAAGAVSPK